MTLRMFGPYTVGPAVGDDQSATAFVTTEFVTGYVTRITYNFVSDADAPTLTIYTAGSSGSMAAYLVASLATAGGDEPGHRLITTNTPTIDGTAPTYYTTTQTAPFAVSEIGIPVWDKLVITLADAMGDDSVDLCIWVED